VRRKARIHSEHAIEAVNEQAGCYQQDQAQGGLRDDQGTLQPVVAPPAQCSPGIFAESPGWILLGGAPGGQDSEQESGQNRKGECENEYFAIQGNLVDSRQIRGQKVGEGPQQNATGRDTQGAAGRREHQGFEEQLAQQLAA